MIFSMLVGALYALLFGSLRLREATFQAVESGMPREQVALILRRDFEHLVVPAGVLAGPLLGTMSEERGQRADTVTLFTTTGIVDDNHPWSDIQKVEYVLEEAVEGDMRPGMELVRRVERNLLASSVNDDMDDLGEWRLLGGVQGLQFEYWKQEEGWLDSWDSTAEENGNPQAVRMRMTFVTDSETNRTEPPLEMVFEVLTQPRTTPDGVAGTGV
jgi:hypothetical protein